MIDIVRECRKIVCELRNEVSAVKASHVNREDLKTKVRDVVDGYFRSDRPILLKKYRDDGLFKGLDNGMHELLRFTQARTAKCKYLIALSRLQKDWANLEVGTIQRFGDLTGGEVEEPSPSEQSIIRALEKTHAPAALCYKQGLGDLNDQFKISWRGTATEFREALRETLDYLAPDMEVEKTPGFKLEDRAKGPTMKQKVRFILRHRQLSGALSKPVEDATEIVEEKFGSFVRSVYGCSSASVHAGAGRQDAHSIKRFVDIVLTELLGIAETDVAV